MASIEIANQATDTTPCTAPHIASELATDEEHSIATDVDARWQAELQKIAARRDAEQAVQAKQTSARRWFWLTHHWPDHYSERCFWFGSRHVCRRCSALYPIGFVVAFATAAGKPLWPNSWDPTAIWLLCLPATVAFVGEMLGWFRYSARWQIATTLIAGLAFGKALGYELVERWSSEFWGPIAVFGGIWFFASVFGHRRKTTAQPSMTNG